MECSQLTADDGEECNSNESGWTMYLASPMCSDDAKANGSEGSNVEDGNGYSNERSNGKEDKGKEDKDNAYDDDGDYDSLASDASTGPAQVKVLEGKEEKSHQLTVGCRDQDGNDEKDEIHTKVSTSCSKRAGKMKKGDEKTTRRGHNKRRSSSRKSFFW